MQQLFCQRGEGNRPLLIFRARQITNRQSAGKAESKERESRKRGVRGISCDRNKLGNTIGLMGGH